MDVLLTRVVLRFIAGHSSIRSQECFCGIGNTYFSIIYICSKGVLLLLEVVVGYEIRYRLWLDLQLKFMPFELSSERTSGLFSCLIRQYNSLILPRYYQSTLLLFGRLYWGLGMLSQDDK